MTDAKPKKFLLKRIDRKTGLVREHITIVDAEDAHYLRNSYWVIVGNGCTGDPYFYVARKSTRGQELLHHIILGITGEERVDHINKNTLDNRKANLLRRSERVTEIE